VPSFTFRATGSDAGGNFFPVRERGSDSSRQPLPSNRLLFCSLPGPRANEACDKPKSPQSVVSRDPLLQNGGPDLPLRDLLRQGDWLVKVDLKDAHSTNTPRPPALPPFHCGGSGLPIHWPSIRAGMCPMGLHQDNEGSGDPTRIIGDQNNHLHTQSSTSLSLKLLTLKLAMLLTLTRLSCSADLAAMQLDHRRFRGGVPSSSPSKAL